MQILHEVNNVNLRDSELLTAVRDLYELHSLLRKGNKKRVDIFKF